MNVEPLFSDPVVIDVAPLKGQAETWVIIDNCSLIYAEFETLRDAQVGASMAARELRRGGFPSVHINDTWTGLEDTSDDR